MTKAPAPKRSKPKTPRGREGVKPGATGTKATTDEFEREDMGIAPKE